MPREVVCPNCQHRLLVDADSTEKFFICPRCLGSVVNPGRAADPEIPLLRPVAAPPTASCPDCGERVESSWQTCPHCSCPLRRKRSRLRDYRDAGEERGGDGEVNVTSIVLIVGGFGGALVYILLLMNGVLNFATFDQFMTVTALVSILSLVLIVVGLVLGIRRNNGPHNAVAGVLGGLGIGLVVMLMTIVVVLGAIVFAIRSCVDGCKNNANKPRPVQVQPDQQR